MKIAIPITELDQSRLKALLDYDPVSGIFRWKACKTSSRRAGKIAGNIQHGRRRIKLKGKDYKASRLAWLYMTGEWPTYEIDHKDRNSLNDSFDNLRDVTHSVNQLNRTTGWKRPDRLNAPRKENGYYAG